MVQRHVTHPQAHNLSKASPGVSLNGYDVANIIITASARLGDYLKLRQGEALALLDVLCPLGNLKALKGVAVGP
ncbi:hypothetical protein [Methylobacterium sp. V23]|uniref:hypothetical protein n=1 Tax=Methylobacterium sp. V23 TaxID=2044878 RepID=UPI0015E1B72C|nr:hypothetical protein [Methylobacterium sp. V23]